jgi:aspartate racemase
MGALLGAMVRVTRHGEIFAEGLHSPSHLLPSATLAASVLCCLSANPTLRRQAMKTIGVLGGLGPQATMDFEQRVHAIAQQLIPPAGNRGYPPLVVWYFREAPFVMADPITEPTRPTLPLQANPRLLEAVRSLGALVDFFVITANAPSVLQAELEHAAGKPMLSILATTCAEVASCGATHVGSIEFGTGDIYRRALAPSAITCTYVPPELQARVDGAVAAVWEGRDTLEDAAAALDAVVWLRAQGCELVILGCTEIPLLLGRAIEVTEVFDVINPAHLLAEAAVRRALQ